MKKSQSLESLPNIGKATAAKLRMIGIEDKSDFLSNDPYELYARLLRDVDPSLCRCALATLVGASMGRKWHEVTRAAAAEFQKRYPDHEWANGC